MSERIHALAQLLPGKASLEEYSLEELQHLTKRYPYFAPAQFLLLQKLKAAGAADFETQYRKAVLYFHDPLLFESFISSDRFHADEPDVAPSAQQHQLEPGEVDIVRPAENGLTGEKALLLQEIEEADEPREASAAVIPSEEQEKNSYEESSEGEPQTFFAEQPDFEIAALDTQGEMEAPDESANFPVDIAPANETAESQTEAEREAIEQKKTDLEVETPVDEKQNEADKTGEENLLQELLEEESGNDEPVAVSTEESSASEVNEGNQPVISSESTVVTKTATFLTPTETAAAPPTESGSLLFEPYHTVDYFASQGIKITAEELPKDKLGKQLRSFTEWLKVMKRLPATEIARTPQSSAEKNVETLASHSVVESDVITEAMAEVWIKQGAMEKAIETYNKLSLLNPSKKAYFAAKIENLKGS
jgi:hypothetical protein